MDGRGEATAAQYTVSMGEKIVRSDIGHMAQCNLEQVLFDNTGLLNYGLHKAASCIGPKWENCGLLKTANENLIFPFITGKEGSAQA